MFWSGNFIVVRELNFLLKEENVTLSQVLEADDILQECKADNKALMQFLTRPDILAELITLITEEPPQSVELAQQYRQANIACEVLTSPLSMLSDRLSLDTTQMNRLCDFINRDPPLNPLLASYFSKTVEMLLERSPKQDWYLYHIVCLRVLDFFKSRRDFLPNLLRHISTSAIADTFKYFIRLDDLFNKIVMEWLEEHQFLECLIQIICGTYVSEESQAGPEEPEKGQREPSEKDHVNHTGDEGQGQEEGSQDEQNNVSAEGGAGAGAGAAGEGGSPESRRRALAVASANAAALLCDLVTSGCAADGAATRSRTSWVLVSRLSSAGGVRALLQGVFTSGGEARAHAIVNGGRLLLSLLTNHPSLGAEGTSERSQVELAVAPHLPLLHQALLHHPLHYSQEAGAAGAGEARGAGRGVGGARVHTAALLAHLALSSVEEVPTTMLTLGTPGVLADMFFKYPHNNFLHAQMLAFCRNALSNPVYRTQYATHLLVECDLLTRLMDAFEENENKQSSSPRSGYMGHVTLLLSCVARLLEEEGPPAHPAARWPAFRDHKLYPALQLYDTPLGGSYPSENSYEVDETTDRLATYYDFNYVMATATRMDEVEDDIPNDNEMGRQSLPATDSPEFMADGLGLDGDEAKMNAAKSNFLELANQRFDDDMWDDAPNDVEADPPADALQEVLADVSPWEGGGGETSRAGEGWAQFEGLSDPPADPFAEGFPARGFDNYWPYKGDGANDSAQLSSGLHGLSLGDKPLSEAGAVSLATNLLTAMSAMSPQAIANLVNANLDPLPLQALDTDNLPPADSTAGEVVGCANASAHTADAHADSPDAPAQSADVSANSPTASADAFADCANSPAHSTDALAEATGAFAKVTDLPKAKPLISETDATPVAEPQTVPSDSSDVETSSPIEANATPVETNQNLPPEEASLAESNPPTSPKVTDTKDLTDARSDLSEKVNDISSVEDRNLERNSPTKSLKDSQKETVLDKTNKVLEVAEAASEVAAASER